jgi:GAF domain-containing protein
MQLPIISTKAAFAQFLETLRAQGIRQALAYLLSLTDYRFISVFRFGDGMACATAHYDRENPDALDTDGVPDAGVYCEYVRDGKLSFVTADATADERLGKHPAHTSVVACCALPVVDANGVVLGSLCHYDLVARDPGQIDLALLQEVTGVLARDEALRGPERSTGAARIPLHGGDAR